MKWSEISIHTTNEAVEPISNILHDAGAGGVVIEDPVELIKERTNVFGEIYQLNPQDFPSEGVIIKAYFSGNNFKEKAEDIKEAITQLKNYHIDIGKNSVKLSEVDEEEWATAWKKYFHPVRITDQVTIVPTWEEYSPTNEAEMIIQLDPGMAFGTGTHPTTVLCIRELEKYVKPGATVLDVGTGSGVLSIAAVLFGAEKVLAMDLDEVAVTVATDNCRINNVEQTVQVFQNDLLENISTKADIIVANILAEVIVLAVADVAKLLKDDGIFIASGIINSRKSEVIEALTAVNLEVVDTAMIDDWVALVVKKK